MTKEEAIKIIRGVHDTTLFSVRNALETLIPELTESEDEKIRKAIIHHILYDAKLDAETEHSWVAYLEKLKEQKPIEDKDAIEPTPKQDYSGLTDFERAIHRGFLCAGVENVPVEIIKETAQDCLAHIEQKPAEWSEEDKAMIKNILFVLESYVSKSESASSPSLITTYPTYYKEIDWLKSLRPQPHWKPSEEQMKALLSELPVIKGRGDKIQTILESLYTDLKKL